MSSAALADSQAATFRRWQPAAFENAGSQQGAEAGVRLPTADDIERLQLAAQNEGYSAGYAQGRTRLESELSRVANLFMAARRELDAAQSSVAAGTVELALDIATAVIRRTVKLAPEHIVDVARDAIGHLPLFCQRGRILLNPEDAALVRGLAAEEFAHAGWTVADDPDLGPGDLKLDTGTTVLDATLQTRWARALAAMGRPPACQEGADSAVVE